MTENGTFFTATCLEWVQKVPFGAYLQFLFANASMMTENGTFFRTKSASFVTRNMVLLETFFFSRKPFFFSFYNFITATHDYYSTWFNLSDNFFISEKKLGVIKLKTHYFILYHFMKC
jgi:hypothetical protein